MLQVFSFRSWQAGTVLILSFSNLLKIRFRIKSLVQLLMMNEKYLLPEEIVKMLADVGITHQHRIFSENNQWYFSRPTFSSRSESFDGFHPMNSLGPFGKSNEL